MNKATHDYIVALGNPYAKLSMFDDEELWGGDEALDVVVATAGSTAPERGMAIQAYLFKLEDPYAKLSISPPPDDTTLGERIGVELIWKKRTDVYDYISDALALPLFRSRPPQKLRGFAATVVGLSPSAQCRLYHRISAHLPDAPIVYNRLSPTELDELLMKLCEMADDAAALDGSTE